MNTVALDKFNDNMVLIEGFILSLDVSDRSKDTYQKSLKQFFLWLSKQPVSTVSRQEILDYKGHMVSEGLKPTTVSNYLVAVRKFFEWAEEQGISSNIAKSVKGQKPTKGFRKDPLSVEQAVQLLGEMDRDTPESMRNYAMVNLMIRTGLRTIEIIRADFSDIATYQGTNILWVQGKGRSEKDEFVVLTDDALTPIYEYLDSTPWKRADGPLFRSFSKRNQSKRLTTRTVRNVVKKSLRDIGIDSPRLSAHSMRHTTVTFALLAGASVQEAMATARHKNISTTMIYAQNLDRIADASEQKIDELLKSKLPKSS